MSAHPIRRLAPGLPLAVGTAAVALILGCQAVAPPPPPTAAPAASRTISIEASEYAFNAPESLPAGRVTLELSNHGQEVHHAQLLRLNDGVTFGDFTAALQQEGEGALRLTTLEGGPGAIDPHGTSQVTLDLKPGTYALACFIVGSDGVPHLAKGMLKPVQVTQAASVPAGEPAPAVQGTFNMRDFGFDMPDVLAAGTATYKVTNAGPQPHELNVLKLAPGKVAQDVLAWENAPSGPPPFEAIGGINGLSPNAAGYMTLDLQPGSYVAICHIPDPASGLPHAHLGMLKAFTVRG